MVKLMYLCMHVCPYRGEFSGRGVPIFVVFMGTLVLSTKNLYSVKGA